MGYFIDNKLIDCSLINDFSNLNSDLEKEFFRIFDIIKIEEDRYLSEIFSIFDYNINNDIRLKRFFELFHALKKSIVKYYKKAEKEKLDYMIIFYYFDSDLIPMVKKVRFVPGLYMSNISEYGYCDSNGLKQRIIKIAKDPMNFGEVEYSINIHKMKTIIPLINKYVTIKNQIYFNVVTKKEDYLEYLCFFHKVIDEIRTQSLRSGINISINIESPTINYKINVANLVYDYNDVPILKMYRSEKLSGDYFVKNPIGDYYVNLISCNSFKDISTFSFPRIDERGILPKLIKETQLFFEQLRLHKPISFFSYLERIGEDDSDIELVLEIYHLLKHFICKFNSESSYANIVLQYDENKIPRIIKMNYYKNPRFFQDEYDNISEFKKRLFELIQSDEEISFEINLHNLGNFDEIIDSVVKNDLHFLAPNYYWEYIGVLLSIENDYPMFIKCKKIVQDTKRVYSFTKIERFITDDVTINLTEEQIKLCIWLSYKEKADLGQIKRFLFQNSNGEIESINNTFYELYLKGLIEVCWDDNKLNYTCTFDVDEIRDSKICIHCNNSENKILHLLKTTKSLEDIIKQEKKELAQINYLYDFKTKKYIPSEMCESKIGIGQIQPYNYNFYFKFSNNEMYQLQTKSNPELLKIARCVQRAIDDKLFSTYKHMIIITENGIEITNYFIYAIPIPILRILYMLSPRALEKDFNNEMIKFDNISQPIIKELKRIFSEKLFIEGNKND